MFGPCAISRKLPARRLRFPAREGRGKHIPSRPAGGSWIRRPWHTLRVAAGLPWLTQTCLRFQCITELCEAGVSPELIKKIAGHSTDKMLYHYSHPRFKQQAAALDRLMEGSKESATVQRHPSPSPSAHRRCPYCGVLCAPDVAFCPNGCLLDEDKARKARPWLFRVEVSA